MRVYKFYGFFCKKQWLSFIQTNSCFIEDLCMRTTSSGCTIFRILLQYLRFFYDTTHGTLVYQMRFGKNFHVIAVKLQLKINGNIRLSCTKLYLVFM